MALNQTVFCVCVLHFCIIPKKRIHACVRLCFLLSPHVSSPVGDFKYRLTTERAEDEANFLKRGSPPPGRRGKVPRSSRFPSCQAPVSCPLHPLFILTQLPLLKKKMKCDLQRRGRTVSSPFAWEEASNVKI